MWNTIAEVILHNNMGKILSSFINCEIDKLDYLVGFSIFVEYTLCVLGSQGVRAGNGDIGDKDKEVSLVELGDLAC